MAANPWELRADVRPLEVAADRWSDIALVMSARAEELVGAARHATDGWDAAAAESYDAHRREVLMNLDRFTSLAEQMASSLRAVAELMLAGQRELDREWTSVALVPHDVVGESRQLVFRPDRDEDRSLVTRAQRGADDVRNRLASSLEQESERMRETRAELVTIRTELTTLDRTGFPAQLTPVDGPTGVGSVPTGSTSVPGSAQAGSVPGLAPIGPIDVSMPSLGGIDSTGLAAAGGAAAGGLLRGARRSQAGATGSPPVGGMGAGAMGARAGSASRSSSKYRAGAGPGQRGGGRSSGSGGSAAGRRPVAPRLAGADVEDEETRAAREKEAAREAKRAALEEKRAERAARRAARRGEREHDRDLDDRPEDELDDQGDDQPDGEPDDKIVVVEVSVHDLGPAASASADVPRDERGAERR